MKKDFEERWIKTLSEAANEYGILSENLREQIERNNKILAATRKLRKLNCDYRKQIFELESRCEMLENNLQNICHTMMQNDETLEKVLQSNQYLAGQLEVYKKVYGEIDKK